MRRRLVALTIVPFLLFGAAACGDESGSQGSASSSVDMGEPIKGLEVSGEFGKQPKVTVDAPLKVDEAQSEVLTLGEGNEVVEGSPASLHLLVVNGTTGKTTVGTYEQGKPVTGNMAEGEIFPSVLDAVVGKPVGSRIAIASPPAEAFGAQGAQQYGIGAQDDVVFVVDIMSVPLDGPEGEKADVPEDLPSPVVDSEGDVSKFTFDNAPAKPSDELQVVPLIEGEGEPVQAGDSVTFDYLGQVYGTETIFDESYTTAPRTFTVGEGSLIKAWDEGMVGVKAGSRVMIIAPPEYGYGENGNPQAKIKGTDTLVFVVDVLGVG